MFKEYSENSLTRDEVIGELEKISNLGWEVFQKKDKSYVIKIDEYKEVSIKETNEQWFIVSYLNGLPKFTIYSNSIATFHEHLKSASIKLETNLELEKVNHSIRLKAVEPFSNKIKLISIIGNSKISKIFDPYFDLKSLITLTSLKKLGAGFDQKVDCLTTKPLTIFDQSVIDDFNNEFETNIEVKKCENKEHRRFLILNDNRVILIGCSLNDINKNEAVSEELIPELKGLDLDFFKEEWTRL